MSASTGSTPEWLVTTSAGPSGGICLTPRIWTWNQLRYRALAAGMSTARLSSGSNPDSGSVSYSPAARRRTNSAASARHPVRRVGDPPGLPLLLVSALDARLAQQLAVLLLRHPLAPLLDY